ncbi:MAG: HD-GYP domain-containing protein [Burkholderiaceae bacterium]
MRRKIAVSDLSVGMYVVEICGSWISNPFWRSSFLIAEQKSIDQLRASRIREVWIDTAHGADVPLLAAPPVDDESMPTQPATLFQSLFGGLSTDIASRARPIAEEMARAARVCAQARVAVTSMFREARMGNTVDAASVSKLVQEIADSIARNASALISLARLKTADDYTYMHSVAVCAMMIALARQLDLDEDQVRAAGMAGLLHDMGKAKLPMEVLNKPGKLSEAEFSMVRRHPSLGHRMLEANGKIGPMALDVCLHHHEKFDGSGYPEGLSGAQISLYARMGAVCDVYDAITSNRPYKAGWDPAESMRQMGQWVGTQFDPRVFQAFARSLGIYPVGSLVRLTSGRIGVVTEQCAQSLTTPMVKVFYTTRGDRRISPELVDLSQESSEKIALREDPAHWNFTDIDELWSGIAPPAR